MITICIVANVLLIVGIGACLGEITYFSNWSCRRIFLITHLVTAGFAIVFAPTYISLVSDMGDYGDIYIPFAISPGLQWVWVGAQISEQACKPFQSFLGPFFTSILAVVIIPGIVGMFAGGLQWYVIGGAIDWIRRRCVSP